MSLFGWFRRRAVRGPRVVAQYINDNHVQVTADWPVHDTVEGKVAVLRMTASLLYYVQTGELLANLQQAVAVAGRMKGDEQFATQVLEHFNRLLAGRSGPPPHPGGSPVVPADRVFEKE